MRSFQVFIAVGTLSVALAGCIGSDEDEHAFVLVYDDRISVVVTPPQRIAVHERIGFYFHAEHHDAVMIERLVNGTWVEYGRVRSTWGPDGFSWRDAGDFLIYLDGEGGGRDVHANVTVSAVPGAISYPADEYWEHVHDGGALHYHRKPRPNETSEGA